VAATRKLLQLDVFCLRLPENRNVGVRVVPEREEILVASSCLGGISRQRECSAELQARQRADGIADHNPAVIENLLEFCRRFDSLMCGQMRFATHRGHVANRSRRHEAAERGVSLRQLLLDLVMGHYARAGIGLSQLALAVWA